MSELPFYHDPVMPSEVMADLLVNPDGVYADATLGGGGHSNLILQRFSTCQLYGFDRDPNAIAHASQRLSVFGGRFRAVYGRFSTMADHLSPGSLDGILADLGISSRQVDDLERGFSFRGDQALDLRMNPNDGENASQWILGCEERDLAKALHRNSDVDRAHLVARDIRKIVQEKQALFPADLIEILRHLFPRQRDEINSLAARVIQGIRMEINQEMTEVDELIQASLTLLKPGGRLVFLTYHSVEDRRVKQGMAPLENPETGSKFIPLRAVDLPQPQFKRLHRKPLPPTVEEVARNPRSRSAKLRSYVRL